MALEALATMTAKTTLKALVGLAMVLRLVSQAHGITNKK
jgi:hypothetical protein